ncbi:nucleotidyltransferase domain-containing protein [bacterium]|nr:nucleotidyltransferase domain-containing protein [bacterium]
MSQLTEIVLERKRFQKKYFQNYLHWARIIKKEVENLLGKTRVLIFGSILRKKEVPRDIDILIISPKLTTKEKSVIKAKIWQKIGIFSPFEIHLTTPEEYQNWYQKFIKKEFIEI